MLWACSGHEYVDRGWNIIAIEFWSAGGPGVWSLWGINTLPDHVVSSTGCENGSADVFRHGPKMNPMIYY